MIERQGNKKEERERVLGFKMDNHRERRREIILLFPIDLFSPIFIPALCNIKQYIVEYIESVSNPFASLR